MDREMLMLAAKVVEADQKQLADAIAEVLETKRALKELGEGVYYTPEAICGAGGFLSEVADKFGLKLVEKVKDPAAYWEVAPDVRLTRYRGTNVTRLIAVRKGRDGNADVVFEIEINHKDRQAYVVRDGLTLFDISTVGLCPRRLQTAAISVLRSYLRENAHRHKVTAMARRAAEAAAHE